MEYYDLGRHSRPVTTSSPQAQTWFDRGLVWTYGSNHEEAVWSLHGFHECLVRLGKAGEAAIIGQQLKLTAALADVPIQSSCFCRLDP